MAHRLLSEGYTRLQHLYDQSECRSIIYVLLEEITKMHPAMFLSDKSNELTLDQHHLWSNILSKLATGVPLQYVLGRQEFMGSHFDVDERVLIPRPETEELIEWIASMYDSNAHLRILDIGTGSGCIAISLKKLFPMASVEAWDVSADAINVAKANARKMNETIHFLQTDVFTSPDANILPFDLIVSNPPYIPESEKTSLCDNVLKYEPSLALFVPDDCPLIFYQRIALIGTTLLKNSGKLFFEIHSKQGASIQQLLQSYGYQNVTLKKDLSGNDRMIQATLHKNAIEPHNRYPQ